MSAVDKLIRLVERLYLETGDYIDNPSDAQLWYNRGYANGIVAYFRAQGLMPGLEQQLGQLALDAAELHNADHIMQWHKAYHHGFEMGERESAEVNNSVS